MDMSEQISVVKARHFLVSKHATCLRVRVRFQTCLCGAVVIVWTLKCTFFSSGTLRLSPTSRCCCPGVRGQTDAALADGA